MRESVTYQEILQEGERRGRTEGRLKGEQSVILRQPTRRIGNVPLDQQAQIRALSIYP